VTRGWFVVFEGLDGSGKTTQAMKLAQYLRDRGCEAVTVEEPGGTPVGERIREILLNTEEELEPLTELLLYEASRHQLVRRVIEPALSRGEIVICQRYAYSSLAYQGYGRELPLEWVEELNERATGGLRPDVVVWLDLPAEEGLKRRRRERGLDRIEGEGLEFLRRVERGYRELAQRHSEIVRVDATRDPERVFEEILQVLTERKGGQGGLCLHEIGDHVRRQDC
jgi:dTMP kinase